MQSAFSVNQLPIKIILILLFVIPFLYMSRGEALEFDIKNDKFSLNVKNIPLGDVIKEVSSIIRRRILFDEKWQKYPVSVSFEDVTITEGLNRILKNINHALVYDTQNNILIVIFDEGVSSDISGEQPDKVLLLKPPLKIDIDGTLRGPIIDPLAIEVIPPRSPGKKGITLREWQAMTGQQKDFNPDDIEVIPPMGDNTRGMTFEEFIRNRPEQNTDDIKNLEIIPPIIPVQKGLPPDGIKEQNEMDKQNNIK